MVHIQEASAKLLVASRSHFCQSTILFTRCITFLATSRKQTSQKDVHSGYSKFYCPCERVPSSVVKYRLKSDATVTAADHLVELGMPQSQDEVKQLADNISMRKMDVNVGDLYSRFTRFQQLEKVKEDLLSERLQIGEVMKRIKEGKEPELSAEREKFVSRGRELREEMKQFMDAEYSDLHSQLSREVLLLPTQIHSSTPQRDTLLDEFGTKTEYSSAVKTHIEVGEKLKSLFFRPVFRGAYYLSGDLALMEHRLMVSASQLLRLCGFRHFICPDTVKSNVLEACGMNTDGVFKIEDSELAVDELSRHALALLGVSCPVFVAFLTSTFVDKSTLPIKLFATGQSHLPGDLSLPGLFGVTQTSTVDVFGADASLENTDVFFDHCWKVVHHIYTSLQLHGKIVLVSAPGLKPVESKRVDIYVWSTAYQTYFKSGELRQFGDTISRRLGCRFADEESRKYLHFVHGVLFRVPTVMAALVEQHQAPVLDLCSSLGKSVVHF